MLIKVWMRGIHKLDVANVPAFIYLQKRNLFDIFEIFIHFE